MHTISELNEEAEKLVEAIDLVFSMAEVMMPAMGWSSTEIREIFARASRKVWQERAVRR